MPYHKRQDIGRVDATANEADRFRARMEIHAATIFESVLRRRNWTVPDRDRLADYLVKVVNDEQKRGKRKQGDNDNG